MKWRSLRNGDNRKVRDFLSRWEWKNLLLSRNYRQTRERTMGLPREQGFMVAWYEPEGPSELEGLLYGGGGMILPLLAEGLSALEVFKLPLSFSLGNPRTLMGEASAVKCLEAQIDRPLGNTVNYDLMVRIGETPRHASSRLDIEIRRANPSDCHILFPLQRAYVLEEVLLKDSPFNPRLCLQNLKLVLKNGLVLMACHRGVPVAKAETNARGYAFSQVGGVYTLPSYRNWGIARLLVEELARREWQNKRGLVLFVKKSNLPAQRLYGGGGFRRAGDFRISYYRRR